MLYNNHIKKVINKFFLLTDIPIKSFTSDGELIYSTGYSKRLERIFSTHNVYERIVDFSKDRKESMYILNEPNDTYYIATSICPRNIYRGIFIMGPCSTKRNHSLNVPYKPVEVQSYLITLIRAICADYVTCSSRETNEEYSFHIRKAIDYIDARYSHNINLNHLVKYLGISKSYFCSLFKEETGQTFTEFLNRRRIERSKELLIKDDSSILDIALQVGYNNQNYFNIIFKRITNTTPLEFRQSISV